MLGVAAYIWKRGRETITPLVHELTKGMIAACVSRKDEEDETCLNIRNMEVQRSMVNYRTRKEGEIAPRDALHPTMRVLPDSKMQSSHHSRESDTYKEAV